MAVEKKGVGPVHVAAQEPTAESIATHAAVACNCPLGQCRDSESTDDQNKDADTQEDEKTLGVFKLQVLVRRLQVFICLDDLRIGNNSYERHNRRGTHEFHDAHAQH